jgi:hypothetical protein
MPVLLFASGQIPTEVGAYLLPDNDTPVNCEVKYSKRLPKSFAAKDRLGRG